MKNYEDMTVDELDEEHIRIKEEQPDHTKDKLREIKVVRDEKVHVARTHDRAKKLLVHAGGRTPEEVDAFLDTKTPEEIQALIKPFEDIEAQIGVVVTPEPGVIEVKGRP